MNYRELLDVCEHKQTDLWNVCYPRIYRDIQDYGSPKVGALAYMCSILSLVSKSKAHLENTSYTNRNIYMAASAARQYNFPNFFITRELYSAISNTDIPKDVMWQKMDLPFESGIFCLPKMTLQHPIDGECDFIGWFRAREGMIYQFSPLSPKCYFDSDRFIVFTALRGHTKFPLLEYVIDARYAQSTGDAIEESIINNPRKESDLPLVTGEAEFLSTCRSLAFGFLLAMHARSNLITYGKGLNKIHRKSGREIWTPNIIGREYRIRLENIATSTEMSTSPRIHWRRGHYRQQPHGLSRSSVKTIWIEPMLIGKMSSSDK